MKKFVELGHVSAETTTVEFEASTNGQQIPEQDFVPRFSPPLNTEM